MKYVLILVIITLNSFKLQSKLEFKIDITIKKTIAKNKVKSYNLDSINLNLLNQITDYELNKIQIQKYFNYYNNLKEYEVENLICIVRLNEVWEYMECQGVPKFVSISFFIEETMYGKSKLFKNQYNLGGIKAFGKQKGVYRKDDCGSNLCKFRSFKDLKSGVDEWIKVLKKDRYMDKISNNLEYKSWIKAYEKGGYWTSPVSYKNRIYYIKKLNLNLI